MTFWGSATYGLSRPDVATYLGHARYPNSGYTFTKAGLASGQYSVQVWVRNTVTFAWNMFPVTSIGNAGRSVRVPA